MKIEDQSDVHIPPNGNKISPLGVILTDLSACDEIGHDVEGLFSSVCHWLEAWNGTCLTFTDNLMAKYIAQCDAKLVPT